MFNQFKDILVKRPKSLALLVSAAILGLVTFSAQAQEDELLPADEAFAFEARTSANSIDAKWEIAEGYYMYRDKLSFSLADQAGNPIEIEYEYPESKTKEDPAFGNVEVYLKHAEFSIPLAAGLTDLVLTVKGQGCNEPIGVCYPPITHELPLTLAAADLNAVNPLAALDSNSTADPAPLLNASPDATGTLGSIDELRNLLGGAITDEELLAADEAFNVTAVADRAGINLRFNVADGYYLYQNKLKFSSNTHVLAAPILPEGELKQDEYFGEVVVYKHQFDALLQLAKASGDDTITLDAQYQGCAEFGVCYPPQIKTFELSIPDLISSASAQSVVSDADTPVDKGTPGNAVAAVETTPANANVDTGNNKALWWVLLTAFAAGIALTFTPCVLPLIPILSSVIAGQGESVTKRKAASLAAIYVLGTAVTYAAIGAVAGATGDQLQAYFQNVWAIGTMALIFAVMSLSMFGLFEIQMPSFIQSRMAEKSQGIKGGSAPMVFALGAISALIVGACVSPVLISFLSIAIAKGSATLGAMIMFAMAMGMGIPLILIGMGAGHLIPKAGAWMDKVKYVFGVMLLAVAIYLLTALQSVPVLYLWAALLIVVAIYLGATQSLPAEATGWSKLFKGLGTISLLWGVMALVGAIYGQRDILKPLPERLFTAAPAFQNGVAEVSEHIFTRVNNMQELDAQFAIARQSGKKIMIDYYADWCVDCLKMEDVTFSDPIVSQELLAGFIPIQVDVTDPKDQQRAALKKRFGVFGPPAVLFFDSQGKQLEDKSFYGYKKAQKFLEHIRSI